VLRQSPGRVWADYPTSSQAQSHLLSIIRLQPWAAEGILATIGFLRQSMLEHPEFVQFGISEYWQFPRLKDQLGATARAARELLERTLVAATPALRQGLDVRAASLSLIGLIFVSVVWSARGWIEQSDDEWRAALTQGVDCLLSDT
jgi:hypothetical protein